MFDFVAFVALFFEPWTCKICLSVEFKSFTTTNSCPSLTACFGVAQNHFSISKSVFY